MGQFMSGTAMQHNGVTQVQLAVAEQGSKGRLVMQAGQVRVGREMSKVAVSFLDPWGSLRQG
jgi:hypothetical protein